MNYKKIYTSLIERGQARLLEGYQEKHHIIPRCIGGTDHSDNLVYLTPEEHYLAHQLLVKIYPKEYKLVYAARMMTIEAPTQKRTNNKMYGWLKKQYDVLNRGKKVSKETKKKLSDANKGKSWEEVHGVQKANELKERHAKRLRGKKRSKIIGQKISAAKKGKPSPRKGKTLPPEHAKKISDAKKGHKPTAETRKKISESNKGQIPWNKGKKDQFAWFTNGITESYLRIEESPAEWHRGRSPSWIEKVTGST